jgi:hypothetical protein
MMIQLEKFQIAAALPRIETGLNKYMWLQANRDTIDIRLDTQYKKKFNHFYRVRRGTEWQDHFYALLENKKGKPVQFSEVLNALHKATNRYEASFASKLLATIDPSMPVIDSIVLRNLKLKLPAWNSKDRLARICELHSALVVDFNEFLSAEKGKYLVRQFHAMYPGADVTDIKILDLVLWQTRAPGVKRP